MKTYELFIYGDIHCITNSFHKNVLKVVDIPIEIKGRLKSGNACYYSVQNLLSSSLLSKNIKIKIHRTIIFPFALNGFETWLFTQREEHRLRVFENRVLRGIFGLKRDGVTEEWRKLHNEVLNDLYTSPNIILMIKLRRMRWAGHVAHMGREEVQTGFWWGSQRKRDHLEDPRMDGKIILRWIFRKLDGDMDWLDLVQVSKRWWLL